MIIPANQNIIQSSSHVCKRRKEVVKAEHQRRFALLLNLCRGIMCLSLKATESVENFLEPPKNF